MADILDIAAILAAETKLECTEVKCSELGGVLYIAQLTADERDLCETQWASYKAKAQTPGDTGFRKYLVTWCLCNKDNQRTFSSGSDEYPDDSFIEKMDQIGKKIPLSDLSKLFNVAARKTGLTREDQEELEKN